MSEGEKRQRTGEFWWQTCSNWHISARHFQWTVIFLTEADFFETVLIITSQTIMKPRRLKSAAYCFVREVYASCLTQNDLFYLNLLCCRSSGLICVFLWLLCHMLFFTGVCTRAIACMYLLWGFMNYLAALTTQLCREVDALKGSPQTESSSSNGWCSQNKREESWERTGRGRSTKAIRRK